MFGLLLASVTDPTVPTSEVPVEPSPAETGKSFGSSIADVVSSVWDNLGDNGYQTGVALVVATVTLVVMLNLKVSKLLLAPVAVGAFWAGWLGWNTITAQDNPLFPGDVSATKLWDVGRAGDNGFLIVVAVACAAAIFLWRTGTALASRLLLLLGAVLGASFLYNLVEAVRVA